MNRYIRTLITGTLITESNLHIGTGEEMALDGHEGSINIVVRAHSHKPYIPASSLRGFLRAQITDPVLRQILFGLGRQRSESEETGNAGQLRLYDAQLQGIEKNAQYISRTSIDPVTRTAKAHHLSTHEVIPSGSRFELRLELDNSTEVEIKALLQALATLGSDNPDGQIGKGKSIGQGRITWALTELLGLTEERLKQWLKPLSEPENSKKKKFKKGKLPQNNTRFSSDPDFVKKYFKPLDIIDEPAPSTWKSIEFTLQVNSPILINDPEQVKQREQERKEKETNRKSTPEEKETSPDAIYMTHQGQACIPGSTLKGWLRSHCRRILMTIRQNTKEEPVDRLIGQLFGSTETGQGVLKFQDALADIDKEKHQHSQTFIAIDRFTGGTQSGALYNVEAIWPDYFSSHFHYHPKKLEPWMKLLLLYALRDTMEGDLVLGWGKSRGYGQLTMALNEVDFKKYSEEELDIWHTQLAQEVAV